MVELKKERSVSLATESVHVELHDEDVSERNSTSKGIAIGALSENDVPADAEAAPKEAAMTATHIQANKEAMNFYKWADCLFWMSICTVVIGGGVLVTATLHFEPDMDKMFWLNKVATLGVVTLFQFIAGWATLHWGVKVNYTRKFLHFNYFAWPILMEKVFFQFESTIITGFWQVWIILFGLLFVSEPMVNRMRFFRILYAALDRPEDHPYTRLWFISQLCVSLPVIAFFHVWMSKIDEDSLVFIPIIVLALGDGLAEPVGVRFGKHKYKVPRLCGRDRYYRSYEGSSMVFLVSVIACAAHYKSFENDKHFAWCICIIPFLETLIEAWAPHTWDNPLILAGGYLVIVAGHYALVA
eukprot:TRINITY_DN2165_c0_g1_i1.p1 TRINITY_DN2165_c0_g1~~TRINITY_DN2165_c0_g1_i1.p1  ORF type:complete len:356 (+),score=90.72 TRINITY_DN2165_c0_g1_i1:98-1165(+)